MSNHSDVAQKSSPTITDLFCQLRLQISLRGSKGVSLYDVYMILDKEYDSDCTKRLRRNKYLQKYLLESVIRLCNESSDWRCMYILPSDDVVASKQNKESNKAEPSRNLENSKHRIFSYEQLSTIITDGKKKSLNSNNNDTINDGLDNHFDLSEYKNIMVYTSLYDMHKVYGLELVEDYHQHEKEDILILEALGR